ncbi:MAG: hypothetical protein ACJ8BW_00965 [Ktedonobacteraceae bacterium]
MDEENARQLAHELSTTSGEVRAYARQLDDKGWGVYVVTTEGNWVISKWERV